jgi:hypothetical protein
MVVGQASRLAGSGETPDLLSSGGTNIPAASAFEVVAPLHAALTSQRDVPTALDMRGTSESISPKNSE